MSQCCCVGPRVVVGGPAPEPPPPLVGQQVLPTNLNLTDGPANTWLDSALTLTLPEAGTYRIGGAVLGGVTPSAPTGPNGNSIRARLFDVTAGTAVADSERFVVQRVHAGEAGGNNATAPMDHLVTVTGPTVLRLQGQWSGSPVPTFAAIRNIGTVGKTVLNFERIAR